MSSMDGWRWCMCMMKCSNWTSCRSWIPPRGCANYGSYQTMTRMSRMSRRIMIMMMRDLTRMREWMCSRRINSMHLTRNPIARWLWMPQWFAANSDIKTRHTDLTHINDYWSISTLRRMMSCTRRMSRMRLMRIVNIRMRIVNIMMRAV